jgi:hypothetical protein
VPGTAFGVVQTDVLEVDDDGSSDVEFMFQHDGGLDDAFIIGCVRDDFPTLAGLP